MAPCQYLCTNGDEMEEFPPFKWCVTDSKFGTPPNLYVGWSASPGGFMSALRGISQLRSISHLAAAQARGVPHILLTPN